MLGREWVKWIAGAVIGLAPAGVAAGTLSGSTVTGVLNLSASSANFFDPANGFVPSGFLNSSSQANSPIVTIVIGQSEFGFQDNANAIAVDFGSSTLSLSDLSANGAAPLAFSFTDTAFNGLGLVKTSDTFPGGISAGLSGSTITLATSNFSSPGSFNAQFTLEAVPEPAGLSLLVGGGLIVLGRPSRPTRR